MCTLMSCRSAAPRSHGKAERGEPHAAHAPERRGRLSCGVPAAGVASDVADGQRQHGQRAR